jgi:signal transduction histidine kinase
MDNRNESSQLPLHQGHKKHVHISSSALLAALWDSTSDLFAAINKQFTLITSNKAFNHKFAPDYQNKPIYGENILMISNEIPGMREIFKENCDRAFQGETTIVQYPLCDNHIYETIHMPVFDKHQQCVSVLLIFRDVMAHIEVEEELQRVKEWQRQFMHEYTTQMQQVNTLQDNFIAVISHEFRTTLTGIQGFSELLCKVEMSEAEKKEYATDINADALRLSRMIDTILDLQLMRSGKITPHQELVDLHTLLQATVEKMRPTTSCHTIHLFSNEHLGRCTGDWEKLEQAISNLLSNAIKYSPDGGDIIVHGVREGVILHVTVQDHGRGIPEDALTTIFETYNQGAIEKTRHIQGTGLGLALVRQIVQMHGGTVWAESKIGQGATFHITLPLQLNSSTAFSDGPSA